MSDTKAVVKILEHLPDTAKDVDILVNNAGLALGTAKAQDVDLEVRPSLLP
jgi:NADP-dependent 3-hydroxy acid dehydrogenase YdfG